MPRHAPVKASPIQGANIRAELDIQREELRRTLARN